MAGVNPSNVPIITPFGGANPNLSPISSGAWASGNITDGRAISNTVNDPFNVLSAFAQGSQLGGVPLWSSAIPYATGAVVSRLAGGSIKWFTALTPVTAGNLPPETNPTLWTVFTSGSTSLFNSDGSQFDWTTITTSTSVLVINGTAGNAMSLPPTGLLNNGTSIRLENISSSNYRFNITGTQTIIGNYNAGSTSTFFVLPAGANVLLIISGNTMAFYSFGIGVGSNFIGQTPQLINSTAVPGMAALPAISGENLTNLPIPPPLPPAPSGLEQYNPNVEYPIGKIVQYQNSLVSAIASPNKGLILNRNIWQGESINGAVRTKLDKQWIGLDIRRTVVVNGLRGWLRITYSDNSTKPSVAELSTDLVTWNAVPATPLCPFGIRLYYAQSLDTYVAILPFSNPNRSEVWSWKVSDVAWINITPIGLQAVNDYILADSGSSASPYVILSGGTTNIIQTTRDLRIWTPVTLDGFSRCISSYQVAKSTRHSLGGGIVFHHRSWIYSTWDRCCTVLFKRQCTENIMVIQRIDTR